MGALAFFGLNPAVGEGRHETCPYVASEVFAQNTKTKRTCSAEVSVSRLIPPDSPDAYAHRLRFQHLHNIIGNRMRNFLIPMGDSRRNHDDVTLAEVVNLATFDVLPQPLAGLG